MKNKLKYLLFGLLTLVSLSSATHALELMNASYGNNVDYVNQSNGYTLFKNGKYIYDCIVEVDPDNAASDTRYIKTDPICDSGNYTYMNPGNGGMFWLNGYSLSNSSSLSYYYNREKSEIFAINAIDTDGKIKIHKSSFKLANSGLYNIASKRGSNVYTNAWLRGNGITFSKEDDEQVRWATYVRNMYMLDGFTFSIEFGGGGTYLFDSYKNKAYYYDKFPFSSDADYAGHTIFVKFYNLVPSKVYDIEWNVGSEYSVYFDTSNYHFFSLENEKKGSKEDLKILQKDLKDSLTTLNQFSSYYLGMSPEELGVNATPKVPDGAKSENNTTNATEAQYNQCIAKYTNMRALTAHSDGCFGKDYNNEERMKYWANVIDDNDAGYTARDKTRYRRCYMFANYKAGLKKKLGEARDPFRKEWKSEYLGLEAKDVNPELLCGSKPSSSKKDEDYSYFAKPENNPALKAWDWLRGRRGEPALTTEKGEKLYDVDFQSDYNDLRSLYWKCQGLDRFGITKSLTQTSEQKQSACSKYASKKSEILKKWQGAKLSDFWDNSAEKSIQKLEKKYVKGLASNFANDFKDTFSDLSDNGEALLNSVKVPFNSGYNAILPLKCSNNSHIEMMDYILWGLFAILAFTFFRML